MDKFKDFIVKMLSSNSNVSSKRVCGVIGWILCLLVMVYCSIQVIQAPEITEIIIWASTMLLGVDSITKIWKK